MMFASEQQRNFVRIVLPRDVPLSLEGKVGMGEVRMDLGGLWLIDANLTAKMGEFTVDFDEPLLAELDCRGVRRAFVTLHVGAGTFQPVRVQDLSQHRMHSETMQLDQSVCDEVDAARRRGSRVVAVGTTSVRALESAARDGVLRPFSGDTDIFIRPGYEFRVVDAMVTNFHLPESTLLMLLCAFAGYDQVMRAYAHAVAERYRFFSYGDAMLII